MKDLMKDKSLEEMKKSIDDYFANVSDEQFEKDFERVFNIQKYPKIRKRKKRKDARVA